MSLIRWRDSPDGMHNMKSVAVTRDGGQVGKVTIRELLNRGCPLTNVDTMAPAVTRLGRRRADG